MLAGAQFQCSNIVHITAYLRVADHALAWKLIARDLETFDGESHGHCSFQIWSRRGSARKATMRGHACQANRMAATRYSKPASMGMLRSIGASSAPSPTNGSCSAAN